MKLADFLRTNRVSDIEFGSQVNASTGAVRKWRSGERIPRPEQMVRIREATGGAVTADDFYPAERAAS